MVMGPFALVYLLPHCFMNPCRRIPVSSLPETLGNPLALFFLTLYNFILLANISYQKLEIALRKILRHCNPSGRPDRTAPGSGRLR